MMTEVMMMMMMI